MIELMRVALGEGKIPRTREFWTWKHRANPFGPSPMWLATANDSVIGVRLFMRWRWQWAGGTASVQAVRAVDTATDPQWQGKGIFKRLTLGLVDEMTRAGTAFVFNTPNPKSRPGYLKMGWQPVGRVSLWVKPCRPIRALSSLLVRSRAVDSAASSRPAMTDAARELLQAADRAELFTRVAARVQGYATSYSANYLDWRYLSCPAAVYELTSLDPRRALVVQRSRARAGLHELTFTDLMVESSLNGIRTAVASVRAALAQTRPDYAVAALRRDGAEAAVLSACGFVPAPRLGPIFTVRELARTPAAPDPTSAGNFHASIGDLELF